jgi:hypothetical protein
MGIAAMLFYKAVNWLALSAISSRVVANDIAVLPAAAFGACIYFAVMILIRGISKGDIMRLPFGSKVYKIVIKIPIFRKILEPVVDSL